MNYLCLSDYVSENTEIVTPKIERKQTFEYCKEKGIMGFGEKRKSVVSPHGLIKSNSVSAPAINVYLL